VWGAGVGIVSQALVVMTAMAISFPPGTHCGTQQQAWLSGWALPSDPPIGFNEHGRYPTSAEGVVEMTACISYNNYDCADHAPVGVVRCGEFLLWRLSYMETSYTAAYCTAPSGL
jgi:hypothetical protein